jgi:hypothetical protein
MKFTLFYSTDITQGNINYRNETVTLTINGMYLHPHDAWITGVERSLQAVYDGLHATGKAREWDLHSWPYSGVTDLKPFQMRSKDFRVVIELVNDNNKVIKRGNYNFKGSWGINFPVIFFSSLGDPRTTFTTFTVTTEWGRSVMYNSRGGNTTYSSSLDNVSAHDITNTTRLRVSTINGESADVVTRRGDITVRALSKQEFDKERQYVIRRGELRGFTRRPNTTSGQSIESVDIPSTIWGDTVTSIGNDAFGGIPITNITIPSNVTVIGEGAFRHSNVLSGGRYFPTKVVIGANVNMRPRQIGFSDTYDSQLRRNVQRDPFRDFYIQNNRRAGTYTFNGARWNFTPCPVQERIEREERERIQAERTTRILEQIKDFSPMSIDLYLHFGRNSVLHVNNLIQNGENLDFGWLNPNTFGEIIIKYSHSPSSTQFKNVSRAFPKNLNKEFRNFEKTIRGSQGFIVRFDRKWHFVDEPTLVEYTNFPDINHDDLFRALGR